MVLNLKFQGLASIMETELNHNMDKIMRAGLNTPDHLKTDNAEFDTPNAQSMNSKLDKPIVNKQLPEPPTKDSLIPVNFSTKATLTSEEN
ncbi:hypothetical protein M8J75_014765 [Diaphorina citri]|nr:hypothetical protein M8J75_014765 [Diaphorina citri]